jgi:hypothetical protein
MHVEYGRRWCRALGYYLACIAKNVMINHDVREIKVNNRANLRVGGIATLIGGIGKIVVNVLHPRPPQRTDELLTLVASIPH